MDIYPQIRPHIEKIEKMMEDDIASEDPRVYGVLLPYLRSGGKRIRPVLSLLSAGATGTPYDSVMELASIIELFHNFTLIHDDIEDGSQFRRGIPALHIAQGIPIALNSGDALYTLLWKKLVNAKSPKFSPAKLIKLQKLYADSFKKVVDGQGIELSWIKEGKFNITEKDYLEMISGKTAALMSLSCEIGALQSSSKNRSLMRKYGYSMGLAFQIHDDVLNLTGSFEKYKKEIGGDISEGKRTLMVVKALQIGTEPDKEKLTSILASHSKNQSDISDAINILKKYGTIEYARKAAISYVEDAKKALSKLEDSTDKQSLLNLADYVVKREQ
ncbi:polyprenyl synthetase family protein [Candidatus Micrarchaeota archaeon]|nr:polyprenyl synthetase family protein [Candidatus Micrarchaeota archaeon]